MIRFGNYVLLRPIGAGGMAEVYVARRANDSGAGNQFMALKRILPRHVGDERFRRMFRSEAELSVMLSNSNIVKVFEEGEIDGCAYMVMEWVNGASLHRVMPAVAALDDDGRCKVAAYVAMQVLHALNYAHNLRSHHGDHLGIVHRDVSPQNVLASIDGEVKLLDFGIARKAYEESSGLHVMGKIRWMAPEHAAGNSRSPLVDLYAAGAILHSLLEGHRFRDDVQGDDRHLYADVMSGRIPPLQRPVPDALRQVVDGLLVPDPSARIQTADEARRLLKRWSGYSEMRQELGELVASVTGNAVLSTGPMGGPRLTLMGQALAEVPPEPAPIHSEPRPPSSPPAAPTPTPAEPLPVPTAQTEVIPREPQTAYVPPPAPLRARPTAIPKSRPWGVGRWIAIALPSSILLGILGASGLMALRRTEPVPQPASAPNEPVVAAPARIEAATPTVDVANDPASSPPSTVPVKTESPKPQEPLPDATPADEPAVAAPAAQPVPVAAEPAQPASTAPAPKPRPTAQVGAPVVVHIRLGEGVSRASLRFPGMKQIEADPRFDGKVPSGTYVLRWRADDGAWRSKKIDLAENAEYKLTVGAGAVELMQVGRGN